MSIQKFIVARDDTRYHAWPDVTLTKSGRLVCVFTECDHHRDRSNSRLMITFSDDRGRTWSPKKAITDYSPKEDHYNCSRIITLDDGRLLVCVDRGDENINSLNVQHLFLSRDDGETFEPFKTLPFNCIVPDKPLVTSKGRIIYCGHNKNPETDKLTQYAWYSDDGGKTWSDRVTVADDDRFNLCEGSIIELPGGELVCFMRENSAIGIDCKKAISYDGGENWKGVFDVPIPGCHRPVAGILKDGRVMITHRFMQGGKGWLGSWTQNVFAAFMDPSQLLCENRNEQSVRIMPLDYDRSSKSDLGYTGWVQFDDGEIYVVNYIVDDAPKAHIRGYSFYPEDVLIEAEQ
ncbi:MAG: exo-alpha-sialidase [Clostridia bacterium]|nr:exo-alpha-sialidase [Clostridia bacterium]